MATEKRLIDANRIPYHKSGFPKGDGFDSRLDWAFREDIDKAPTVDAVEVVRCEKCSHWREHDINGKRLLGRCQKWGKVCKTSDFCSYGERRTNT